MAACSTIDDASQDAVDQTVAQSDIASGEQTTKGDGHLVKVYAEYSFCYSTDDPDPQKARTCEDNITYQECKEFDAKIAGQASTFFYAVYSGGEAPPASTARYAQQYRMHVEYGEGKTLEDDLQAIFPGMEDDFMVYDLDDCYPTGDFTIYNEADKVVGKMSFDNTNN